MNRIVAGVPNLSYSMVVVGSADTLRLYSLWFPGSFFDVISLTNLLGSLNLPVVNLSYALRRSFVVPFNETTSKFQQVFTKYPNTIFVIAAGDNGGNANDYTPGNLGTMSNVLTVGASDLTDTTRSGTTCFGKSIESPSGIPLV